MKNENLLAILEARGFSLSLFDGSLSNSINIDTPISQHVSILFQSIYGIPYPDDRDKFESSSDEIARFHHGIQHVTRATYYLMVFANLYRKYGDRDAIKLTDEDVKLLQIATLLHDSARLDDGKDLWDSESAVLIYFYLRNNLNVSPEKAKMITEATANKDRMESGETFEINEAENGEVTWRTNINPNAEPPKKNIYQKLIHDADCLDVIRVRGEFDKQYLDIYQQYIMNDLIAPDPNVLIDLTQMVREATDLIALQGDANGDKNKEVKKIYENDKAYDLLVELIDAPETNQTMLASLGKALLTMPKYQPTQSIRGLKADIADTQLKKSKVLDDIRHQRHRLFSRAINEEMLETPPPRQSSVRPQLSQSELHLQKIMGDDFDAKNSIAANINLFLDKYCKEQYSEEEKARLINQAVEMIQHERENPDTVFFYHGVNSDISYAYAVYSKLYQILNADSSIYALRTDNALFHKCLNINEFITHFLSFSANGLVNNYATGYMECALSTNIFLFGNHVTAGSNTIKFYTSNKGAAQITLKNMFEASLKAMGVSDKHVSQLANLVDDFPEKNQGALYQIGIPKSDVDNYAYTSGKIGVINPAPGTTGKSISVTHLLETLQNEESIPADYVESVEARVMVPPDASITTEHFLWGEDPRPEDSAAFATQLDKLVDQIAYDILLNQNQFNKLNSKTALLRYLPDIMRQAGIPEDENISDDLIIQLIELGNFDSIKTIIEAHPEFKERPLVDTRIAYTNKNIGESAPKTLLERLLAVRFSGETIRSIYGEDFYKGKLDNLPFHQVVGALPVTERSKFVLFNKGKISDGNILALVLDALPEDERFDITTACGAAIHDIIELCNILNKNRGDNRLHLINQFSGLIRNAIDISDILTTLPLSLSKERLDFANRFSSMIKDGIHLAAIMYTLHENDRLPFAIEHKNAINNEQSLHVVVKTLPVDQQLMFAEMNEGVIQTGMDLCPILESLSNIEDRKYFLAKHESKINDGRALSSILYILPTEERFEFADKHRDKIQTGNDIAIVIAHLKESDRYHFAMSENSKVVTCDQFIDILHNLPNNKRMKYALLHNDKIQNIDQLKWTIEALPNKDKISFALNNMNKIQSHTDYELIRKLLPESNVNRFTSALQSYFNLSLHHKEIITAKIDSKHDRKLYELMGILDSFTAKIACAETADMLNEIVSEIRKTDQYKTLIEAPDLAKKILQHKFNPISALNQIINEKRNELALAENIPDLSKKQI